MKRPLLVFSLFMALSTLAQAQTADTTQPAQSSQPGQPGQSNGPRKQLTPTKRAARQLNVLQEKLNLTQDQVIQVNMILLNRETALDSLKNNQTGDRKSDMHAHRNIARAADQQMNALLTEDQRKLYQQWKQTQKMERREKMNGSVPAGQPPVQ